MNKLKISLNISPKTIIAVQENGAKAIILDSESLSTLSNMKVI